MYDDCIQYGNFNFWKEKRPFYLLMLLPYDCWKLSKSMFQVKFLQHRKMLHKIQMAYWFFGGVWPNIQLTIFDDRLFCIRLNLTIVLLKMLHLNGLMEWMQYKQNLQWTHTQTQTHTHTHTHFRAFELKCAFLYQSIAIIDFKLSTRIPSLNLSQ